MDPAVLQTRGQGGVPTNGKVISVVLALVATSVLSGFLVHRITVIKVWKRLPFVAWLVLAIFADSYSFIFITAVILQFSSLNYNEGICTIAVLLCILCYISTKILIYLFLVERAHIVRCVPKPRLKSKLYIFNSFGILGVYSIVVIFDVIYRIAKVRDGLCYIGIRILAMVPLISFDLIVNIYLTILFIIPLKNIHSFKNIPRTPANVRLHYVAFRTFIGVCCTLVSSFVNLTVLMVLHGEPVWICFMCCNSDILFSAVVINWVTSKDNAGSFSLLNSDSGGERHFDAVLPSIDFASTAVSTSPNDVEAGIPHGARSRFSGDRYPKVATPPGVLVTTTIRHQSMHSDPTVPRYDELEEAEGGFENCGYSLRQPSCGTLRREPVCPMQTRITAGEQETPPRP